MDNAPLISVIVPVYNVEPYLDRCVQSIVDQTYTNLEIILVDDGSPDNCPAMCDAWAKKDSRIRVIHQKNMGGGAARNVALQAATGDYIAFVDSDDYISPLMYAYLVCQFDKNTDIAECGFLTVRDDHAMFDDPEDPVNILECDRYKAMGLHIDDHRFWQIIWNKLYRKSVVEDIFFPMGKRVDDEFWTYRVIANAKYCKSSPIRLYAYRQQDNSVMHQLSMTEWFQAVEAKILRQTFLEKNMPSLAAQGRISLFFTCLYHGQLALRDLKGAEQKQAVDRLIETIKSRPLTREDKKRLPFTHRLWAEMSRISFVLTCRVRNMARVGL